MYGSTVADSGEREFEAVVVGEAVAIGDTDEIIGILIVVGLRGIRLGGVEGRGDGELRGRLAARLIAVPGPGGGSADGGAAQVGVVNGAADKTEVQSRKIVCGNLLHDAIRIGSRIRNGRILTGRTGRNEDAPPRISAVNCGVGQVRCGDKNGVVHIATGAIDGAVENEIAGRDTGAVDSVGTVRNHGDEIVSLEGTALGDLTVVAGDLGLNRLAGIGGIASPKIRDVFGEAWVDGVAVRRLGSDASGTDDANDVSDTVNRETVVADTEGARGVLLRDCGVIRESAELCKDCGGIRVPREVCRRLRSAAGGDTERKTEEILRGEIDATRGVAVLARPDGELDLVPAGREIAEIRIVEIGRVAIIGIRSGESSPKREKDASISVGGDVHPGSKTAQWVRGSLDESSVIGQVGARERTAAAEGDKGGNGIGWVDRAKILKLKNNALWSTLSCYCTWRRAAPVFELEVEHL